MSNLICVNLLLRKRGKQLKNFQNSINNTIYIIDFDHTITTFDSNTSIGVYSLYLGQKYKKKKATMNCGF